MGGKHAKLPRRARLPESLRVVGMVMVALAALLFIACGYTIPVAVRTALPIALSHAPASALTLAIQFDDLSPFDGSHFSMSRVAVAVTVFSSGHAVVLSSQQTLRCNGVPFPNPETGYLNMVVARQPAGGSYAFAYTDEQEHTTIFSVPGFAPLTLSSPAPGATVTIPRRVSSVPTPVPTTIPPGNRTPDLDHIPLPIQYALPSLPPGAAATVSMWAECTVSGTASGSLTGCGEVAGPRNDPATGTYVISDASSGYGYGFETFVPGPGAIGVSLRVIWEPVTSFASIKITYNSATESPIVWTAQ